MRNSQQHAKTTDENDTISLDLSIIEDGLLLKTKEMKELQGYIIYKLRKHQNNNSLTDFDERDIMQLVLEKVVTKERRWLKNSEQTPLDFLKGCASSIVSNEGKSRKNQERQKIEFFAEGFDVQLPTFKQPDELVEKEENMIQLLSMISTERPNLGAMATRIFVHGEVDNLDLSISLGHTEKDIINTRRALRRYLQKRAGEDHNEDK